eukprot:CAMPEP_0195304322 /NCGR_PEP_ID=MMETSP0707-20130614/34238_1 /TAXON_ID=33640 /ORGANISM="Asterionellopsis glacialis, Strain CCMP134" /LENGTH=524 /DNA_ID=CAMNT_0040368097 /DNA_START=18 /DNA_END=1588 /DNA_ORIENTATION=+
MSEAKTLFKSSLATSFCNLDSSFVPHTSLEKRTEGWTEVWGANNPQEEQDYESDDEEEVGALKLLRNSTNPKNWDQDEKNAIEQFFSTRHPQLSLTLLQYRPAWFEQALLRIANIPHVVVNSPYCATESTGPLPFLRDLAGNYNNNNNKADPQNPILVGRHHPMDDPSSSSADKSPTTMAPPRRGGKLIHNSILEYLQSEKNLDLDSNLTDTQKSLSHAYCCMIESRLNPILLALKFADEDAWQNVHRHQCIRAATMTPAAAWNGNDSSNGAPTTPTSERRWFPFGSWMQAWGERSVALKQLSLHHSRASVEVSRADARKCYEVFEAQLKQNSQSSSYVLGTSAPSTLDAFLWAHLAEALGDVYLVTVLADFPHLAEYFQRFYDTYFALEVNSSSSSTAAPTVEWKVWNHQENLRNPFQQLPQETSKNFSNEADFKNTVDLMTRLSVHKHDLKEVLVVAKESRESEVTPSTKSLPDTWHRWRMGGDMYPPKTEDEINQERQQQEPSQRKWRKDNKNNDELWIST